VSNNQPSLGGQTVAKPTVGVVGLGAIGDGVATSLLREGFPLVVCDVREEATARYEEKASVAASSAVLAASSDIVVVAVVNDDQVREVLMGADGAMAAAGEGTIFLVMSTISAQCVREVGVEAARRGVAVLDCGVTGGPAAAASGDMVCMVGGDPEAIERLEPFFSAVSSLTVTMGPFGAGLAAKLARNLITYGSWLAAYESQLLAEAAGISLPKLAEVVRASDVHIGGASRLMFRTTAAPFTQLDDKGLVDAMRAGASLAHKDIRAALELAESLDVDLPLAVMAEERCDDVFGLREVGPTDGAAGAGKQGG
jgi:3-hydroxyisobutyrate dehydrogenase-like beta-hydroxyacid dehydrogenase